MVTEVSTLTEKQHTAWNAYVRQKQASIYHDYRWPQLIKNVFGHDSHHLLAIEDGEVVGILPLVQLKSLLFGNFLVSMPYFNYGGVVANSDKIAKSLLGSAHELSDELGCSHIEIRFDTEQKNIALPVRTDKVTMLLDLPDNPDQLWQEIGSKRRAQVKRPVREGAQFISGGSELLDDFYHVFSINMRDLGTPVYSKHFFKNILSEFTDNVFIGIVKLNGEAVAAGFLIGNNGKLEIPWASTLRKVNRLGVNMFLYWNILKTAIEKDYHVFDFGRSSKDAGTLRFKKQWGAMEKQLYWYYDMPENRPLPELNPNSSKFNMAIKIWQNLPVSITKALGPSIVKNLP
ncbi:MAG: FemAB family PEP-CTERM system-associated protein [Gammaproteobacteria bacterium]|nr:FemAB family PEP-CTERM system-associated protein [Gammaproteobacteria bacterium]